MSTDMMCPNPEGCPPRPRVHAEARHAVDLVRREAPVKATSLHTLGPCY